MGSITRDTKVICHESTNMAVATSTRLTTLDTTPDSVEVNACWAPMTSLLSREIRAPVCVRVKNATGMRCT